MKKINFKNLPDTSTPLSAENMNLLQNNIEESTVEVSSTQPVGKSAVWFKESENLFNGIWSVGDINPDTGAEYSDGGKRRTDYIELAQNVYYSISRSTNENLKARFYDGNKKYVGSSAKDGVGFGIKLHVAFQMPINAKYVRFVIEKKDDNYKLMLSKGQEQKPYKPQTNKEILTYNGSGYDKFSVIESGSNSNGDYIKFDDGTMICYRTIKPNISVDSPSGVLFFNNTTRIEFSGYAFSQKFSANPIVSAIIEDETSEGTWITNVEYDSSRIKNIQFMSTLSRTARTRNVKIFAIGRWK